MNHTEYQRGRRRSARPAFVAAGLACFLMAAATGCKSSGGATVTAPAKADTVTTMTGLRYIDYEQGTGPEVKAGATVRVDYAGYLTNGTLFDTSIDSVGRNHDKSGRPFPPGLDASERANRFDRGGYPFEPLEFVVGAGRVIRGWDDGLTTNMRVGGRRRLIIPPDQAYGARAMGSIPPNSTLIFDVHVVGVK